MGKMGITMDGVDYNVGIIFDSLERSFDFVEGPNQNMSINGADILDTLGTKYSFEMEVVPDKDDRSDYDDFYMAISSPNRIHHITMPFNQTVIEFYCKVNSGRDRFKGNQGSTKLWDSLTISVTPISPQRS